MGIFNKAISGGQRIFNKAVKDVGGIFSKKNISKVTDRIESGIGRAEQIGARVVGGIEKATPKIARAAEFFAPEFAPEIAKVSDKLAGGLDWVKKGLEKAGHGRLAVRETGNALLGKGSVLPPPQPDAMGL